MDVEILQDTVWGILFFSQFTIGSIGNFLMLMIYACTFLQPQTKKPIDWIFTHLTLANLMTILFSGVPDLLLFFGLRNFLNDTGCKAVLFFSRVARGLSLSTTSFLSVFQALVITNHHSRWAWFKSKIYTCISSAFLFFWIINMLIYIRVIIYVRAPFNFTGNGVAYNLKYCMAHDDEKMGASAFLGGMVLRDFLCVSLMIWTSVYMVKFLFNHRKNVQQMLRNSLCPQSSLEIKATKTILAHVSCFVFFYWINCCLTIYVTYSRIVPGLENITIFVSSCYPAICPFLLIKNHRGPFSNSTSVTLRKPPQTTAVIDLNALTLSLTPDAQDRKISLERSRDVELRGSPVGRALALHTARSDF